MIIIVNGKQQDIVNNLSVLDFINSMKLNPAKIIIEMNRQIISKTNFESVKLKENDSLEILSLVSGG
jgi:thiamine biosynthesis protein ThiS